MADAQQASAPSGQFGTAAVVIVSGSTPDPDIGQAQNESELVTFFRVRNRYMLDDRILAGAIAAKPGSQTIGFEFIRVAIPTACMVVEWQSWRKGQRPKLPSPYLGEPVLLRQELDFDGMEYESDDKLYYLSSGSFYYAWRDRAAMTLSYPVAPYLVLPDTGAVIVKDGDFIPGILNAGWSDNSSRSAVTQP